MKLFEKLKTRILNDSYEKKGEFVVYIDESFEAFIYYINQKNKKSKSKKDFKNALYTL